MNRDLVLLRASYITRAPSAPAQLSPSAGRRVHEGCQRHFTSIRATGGASRALHLRSHVTAIMQTGVACGALTTLHKSKAQQLHAAVASSASPLTSLCVR